eukprot:NODE_294_length_11497_cov_0.618530.p5 type:complete len:178 gc:universal NODE_294_length_11497_cov_0.618530:4838-4305(-)
MFIFHLIIFTLQFSDIVDAVSKYLGGVSLSNVNVSGQQLPNAGPELPTSNSGTNANSAQRKDRPSAQGSPIDPSNNLTPNSPNQQPAPNFSDNPIVNNTLSNENDNSTDPHTQKNAVTPEVEDEYTGFWTPLNTAYVLVPTSFIIVLIAYIIRRETKSQNNGLPTSYNKNSTPSPPI